MKRIILLSALAIVSLNLFAQRAKEQSWKDLSLLLGQSRISLVVDFSKADILNMDAEDFIAQELDWDKGLAEMKTKFIQAFNEKSSVRAVTSKETDYTLTIIPLTVTESGTKKGTGANVGNDQTALNAIPVNLDCPFVFAVVETKRYLPVMVGAINSVR